MREKRLDDISFRVNCETKYSRSPFSGSLTTDLKPFPRMNYIEKSSLLVHDKLISARKASPISNKSERASRSCDVFVTLGKKSFLPLLEGGEFSLFNLADVGGTLLFQRDTTRNFPFLISFLQRRAVFSICRSIKSSRR